MTFALDPSYDTWFQVFADNVAGYARMHACMLGFHCVSIAVVLRTCM